MKRNSVKYFRFGRSGHIKRNCRTRLFKVNATYEENEDDSFESLRWDQCFTIEDRRIGQKEILVNYLDYQREWILDSSCSHHVIGRGG